VKRFPEQKRERGLARGGIKAKKRGERQTLFQKFRFASAKATDGKGGHTTVKVKQVLQDGTSIRRGGGNKNPVQWGLEKPVCEGR